jgi:hypothetical protein
MYVLKNKINKNMKTLESRLTLAKPEDLSFQALQRELNEFLVKIQKLAKSWIRGDETVSFEHFSTQKDFIDFCALNNFYSENIIKNYSFWVAVSLKGGSPYKSFKITEQDIQSSTDVIDRMVAVAKEINCIMFPQK